MKWLKRIGVVIGVLLAILAVAPFAITLPVPAFPFQNIHRFVSMKTDFDLKFFYSNSDSYVCDRLNIWNRILEQQNVLFYGR